MNRIFIDMDGVLADFAGLKAELGIATGDELKKMPFAFRKMQPLPGAIAAVHSLIGMGFECWVATKPPTGLPQAYADKAEWILEHLPELKRRIIMTHDKGLLGDEKDYLIDDRPHKANCSQFPGKLIVFGHEVDWVKILAHFRSLKMLRTPVKATCRMPGCGNPVESGTDYCAAHIARLGEIG